jgi:hypothetical protein
MQVDFSEYDKSMSPTVIHMAFDIVRSLFEDPISIGFLYYIEYHFVHSVIVLGNGWIFRKKRGIPSGSGFTSLIGSLCHLIVTYEIMGRLAGTKIEGFKARVYGDDGLYRVSDAIV